MPTGLYFPSMQIKSGECSRPRAGTAQVNVRTKLPSDLGEDAINNAVSQRMISISQQVFLANKEVMVGVQLPELCDAQQTCDQTQYVKHTYASL